MVLQLPRNQVVSGSVVSICSSLDNDEHTHHRVFSLCFNAFGVFRQQKGVGSAIIIV